MASLAHDRLRWNLSTSLAILAMNGRPLDGVWSLSSVETRLRARLDATRLA